MESLRIWFLSIAAAVLYGEVQDQVTTRVCVEYFTIGHPDIFGTDSPTLLALGWGFIATWWAGALIGAPLVVACRAGSLPRLRAGDLHRPVLALLLFMAYAAILAGIAGYVFARAGSIGLVGDLALAVPAGKHPQFLADLWAHNAAYITGFAGAPYLCIWARRRRRALRTHGAQAAPQARAEAAQG